MHIRFSVLFLLIFFFSCASDPQPAETERITLEISDSERIIDSSTDERFAMPSSVLPHQDGLFVYDFGAGSIHRFDAEYNLTDSFGRQGGGPGEYQYLAALWMFNGNLTGFDPQNSKIITYTPSGDMLHERSLSSDQFSLMMAAGSEYDFYFQSDGYEGTLLTHSNLADESVHHFGESLTSDDQEISISSTRQAIEREQVPAFMKNRVLPAVNSERIFSFQLTTGVLQAFNHQYEPEWEYRFETDFMDEVFDSYIEANKMMLDRGNIIFLMYAYHLEATDDGVAILFSTPQGTPVTIGWIDNDAAQSALVTYTDLDFTSQKFALSAEGEYVYIINQMEGEIWRVEWPF
jgi:hypothetical protein